MLEFYKKINRLTEDGKTWRKYLIKSVSQLVGIYQTFKDDKEELTSCNDLWKIRRSFRSLVAKIRDNLNDLPNGPVKCDMKEEMAMSYYESYFDKYTLLGISQNNIQIKNSFDFKVKDALVEIKNLELTAESAENKWLLNYLYQILDECNRTGVFNDKEEKFLKIRLYKRFSILEMK
ncbi:hypothetical protein CHS0354_003520 [Potamilus streckersoni]|uniref:Uncharacterized protein n=1 Tax=Potamilus streckersoni TaxID=2493646 RepID=A0AAE0SAQ5_9BIVA|nr:hypothetical protein CHS0354_003520 [Potamilus streckersoni]